MIPAPSVRCLSATVPGHMIRTAHGPNSIEKTNTSHLKNQQDLKTKPFQLFLLLPIGAVTFGYSSSLCVYQIAAFVRRRRGSPVCR
jgi:hypothetical protein